MPGAEVSRFRVFDTGGMLLGPVTMPTGFTVYDIGSDYVLGRVADDLEIEHVVMYRLIK